jgi:BirA family transcriptional regulator, biotin operon repressor / biotin---[acetyl-CoA-carboxylase] ligase
MVSKWFPCLNSLINCIHIKFTQPLPMIGKTIIELDRVDSTNVYASKVFTTPEYQDGTVIWAHEQFAGRGQHDHTWLSEAGKNLTFTVCLKPRFLAPDRQFQLNKAVSLAVLDFIQSFPAAGPGKIQDRPTIKWPNDIYIGDRKMGGILIENKIMGSILETSFVGIGLNINQTRFAPDLPNPVSLIHILRNETVLKDALIALCSFLNSRYLELSQTDQVHADMEFGQNLLGFGQWRIFLCDGTQIEGKIKGVDNSGRLLVENQKGEILYFSHKEIEYLL